MRRLFFCLVLLVGRCLAQSMPVVMLSDLHFDPLRDPGKAARLAKAPETEWSSILRGPATPAQATAFAAIQAKCGSRRGLDSDFTLLEASLQAAATQAHKPGFVTVSGDLLVHQFECRWRIANGNDEGYSAFAEKTTNFVIGQVQAAFAGVPVYIALGNNDSSCGDYRMDRHDRYLKATSAAMMRGLIGASAAEKQAAQLSFEEHGYYTVAMPGARTGRLLVLDDIYLSRSYTTCAGKHDPEPGVELVAWLNAELSKAQKQGEAVWVLSHIPPGVDVYSTVSKFRDVCGGADPVMFLEADTLGATLAKYPGTVRLAVFGHTHNDELRLIDGVPAKVVGSVTPVNGNLPSFTIGELEPQTGVLQDYSVFVASTPAGGAPWAREYRYRETFGGDGFTGATLKREIDGFRRDPTSETKASQAYERSFFPGAPFLLGLIWPQASCALAEHTAAGYKGCVCAQPAAK